MIPTKAQLERAMRDGLTQPQAAERLGCSKETVQRHASGHGIRWPNHGDFRNSIEVVIDGERMTLKEASRRYGVNYKTLFVRHHRGKRGRDLVAPPRHGPAPKHYETGLSHEEWRVVAEYARQRTVNAASKQFGVPDGAINAYLRGEEHRLG